MNIIKVSIFSIIAMLSALMITTVLSPAVGAVDASDAVCDSIGAADPNGDCSGSGGTINRILTIVLNILSFIAGVIAVIMIIIAGIKFVTSQGDPAKVSSARSTVVYAVVGVVIVLISQIIVQFVITESANLAPPADGGYRINSEFKA